MTRSKHARVCAEQPIVQLLRWNTRGFRLAVLDESHDTSDRDGLPVNDSHLPHQAVGQDTTSVRSQECILLFRQTLVESNHMFRAEREVAGCQVLIQLRQ